MWVCLFNANKQCLNCPKMSMMQLEGKTLEKVKSLFSNFSFNSVVTDYKVFEWCIWRSRV